MPAMTVATYWIMHWLDLPLAGWSLGTVGNRIIMVGLFNRAGRSVFGAALYHDMLNVSWQLFRTAGRITIRA